MNILFLSNDDQLATLLHAGFKTYGWRMLYHNYDSFQQLMQKTRVIQGVIIDEIAIPNTSWIIFMRKKYKNCPIFVLMQAPNRQTTKDYLKIGINEVLTKPMSLSDLSSRMERCMKYYNTNTPQFTPTYKIDNLVLDPNAQIVKRGDTRIHFTEKEYEILLFLMKFAHNYVTSKMLLESIWNNEATIHSVFMYMHKIRNKINTPENKTLIHTVRGRGYILTDERDKY